MNEFPLPQFHTDEDYIRAVSEAAKAGKLKWQLESLQRRCKPVDRDFLPKPVKMSTSLPRKSPTLSRSAQVFWKR